MKPFDRIAGRIYPEYWVDCARCRHAIPCETSNLGTAGKRASEKGWAVSHHGWICPSCKEALAAKERP